MWAKAFSPDLETQIPDVNERDLHIELKDHLMAILNLLQAYSEIGPEILVMTSAEAMQNKPIILLKSLCNVQGIGEEELTIMKVKSLRILLSANISGFSPNEVTLFLLDSMMTFQYRQYKCSNLKICSTGNFRYSIVISND